MECPPAYSVPPPQVSLQEIDGVACTADAVPSQSTVRPLHLPWFTPTLYDLHSILLIVIYRRFYHFLFGASHGSVHLSPLTIRYRASSLPLLHLEGNEQSGGTFQHAAYLAFNAFTQLLSSACQWLVRPCTLFVELHQHSMYGVFPRLYELWLTLISCLQVCFS